MAWPEKPVVARVLTCRITLSPSIAMLAVGCWPIDNVARFSATRSTV
jgi:hypothetical protein